MTVNQTMTLWAGGAGAQGSGGRQEHVQLCHLPPGNPDNPQTIRVSQTAATHHLRNHPGDSLGERDGSECSDPGDCDDVNACTSDHCHEGVCVSVDSSASCDDSNVCTKDTCVPACTPHTEFTWTTLSSTGTRGSFLDTTSGWTDGGAPPCAQESDPDQIIDFGHLYCFDIDPCEEGCNNPPTKGNWA